jgi:hypothetical protein
MHGISPLLGLGGDTRDDASLCASLRSAWLETLTICAPPPPDLLSAVLFLLFAVG